MTNPYVMFTKLQTVTDRTINRERGTEGEREGGRKGVHAKVRKLHTFAASDVDLDASLFVVDNHLQTFIDSFITCYTG